jgi:mannose-binding lectin 2
MAIWLTKERIQPGPVFGNQGSYFPPAFHDIYNTFALQINSKVSEYSSTRKSFVDSSVARGFEQQYRYANGRHAYSFPRVSSMLGDGKTSYDFGKDGEGQDIGACSVLCFPFAVASVLNCLQANYRRTNVATKLKITYVKDSFLDVRTCTVRGVLV